MAGGQTQRDFQINEKKQMLVLVRYKPAAAMGAGDMIGGIAGKVQGMADTVQDAANSIPGLNLFFKEEKEPEKKNDKAYNYYDDYAGWDAYMKKMKDELVNKLNNDNETLVFDFDANDAAGLQKEGQKLLAQVKSKVAGWKDYTACFHFVGIGQGGNVANECIKELANESDFQNKWWVQSVVYVGTPLYRNRHVFNEAAVFKGRGRAHSFGNAYDLTQSVIAYFEPNDQLLKMIAESNANLLSVFTGKIKAQLIATLGRLLTIEGFGTSHDNAGNVNKLIQCKDDVQGLVEECISAFKSVVDAVPGLVSPPDLPKLDQMLQGFDAVPGKSVKRLEKFIDELKKVRQGTSLDTSRINLGKLFNFLCPLVDQLTGMLKLFAFDSETTNQLFDKVLDKAGVKKILQPAALANTTLPVDPYIEKVAEMAQKAAAQEGENAWQNTEVFQYDQATTMISTCKSNIAAVTRSGDLDISASLSADAKAKVGAVIAAMLLPMMPGKKKFYGVLLSYIPLDGITGFLKKLTGDAAMTPLKEVLGKVKSGFDFDEGTGEEPGLKKSLQNFDRELTRIKGFLNKNDYPVHRDANSLYFIYNAHNLMLKKPYGFILNTIDRETGYYDYMQNAGFTNVCNLEKNEYRGSGAVKENIQPAKVLEEQEAT